MKGNLPSLKQEALLAYIDGFIKENNYAPSYREVMRALDYKSVSTVAKHIDGLIERGWLVKRDNSARSVEVTYREGRQTAAPDSPAPALAPPAREEWLASLIEARLTDAEHPLTDDDRAALARALGILGLRELAEWLMPADQG